MLTGLVVVGSPDAADEAGHAAHQDARYGELRDEDDEGRVVRPGNGVHRQHHGDEREAPAAAGRHGVREKLRRRHHLRLLLLRPKMEARLIRVSRNKINYPWITTSVITVPSIYVHIRAVSYTHLTLPTICSV